MDGGKGMPTSALGLDRGMHKALSCRTKITIAMTNAERAILPGYTNETNSNFISNLIYPIPILG